MRTRSLSGPPHDAGSARIWLVACAALALVAVGARLHAAFAYPPLFDFDGPGHALNVYYYYEGGMPPLGAWLGFHPPLYHALGALLWHAMPDALPVHALLRLLSAGAAVATAWLIWRALARVVPTADAAVVAVVALCAPVTAISASMLGNETLCALFATAALVRLPGIPLAPVPARRHALVTGIFCALAALSKSTALALIGVAGLTYLLRLRSQPRAAFAAALALAAVPVLVAGPVYLRVLFEAGGSPLSLVSGAASSPHLAAEMASQPPGVRHLVDYLRVPLATFLAPVWVAPGMAESVPGLLYASVWADGHAQFLPASVPSVLRAASALSVAGLLPTGLALVGGVRLLRRRDPRDFGPLLLLALLCGALLGYAWTLPRYSAVKASYLLPAIFPAALCLATGLAGRGPSATTALRAALLAIALGATGLTWYGWWA